MRVLTRGRGRARGGWVLVSTCGLAALAFAGAALLAGSGEAEPGACTLPSAPPPMPEGAVPGWSVRFGNAADDKAPFAVFSDAAFAIGPGETLDPRIAPKDLTALFEGVVRIEQPGRYRFTVEMEGGHGRLTVFGKATTGITTADIKASAAGVRSEWIEMTEGDVAVQIEFARDGVGKARLRTLWECERGTASELGVSTATGFMPEPLNSWRVRVPAGGVDAASAYSGVFRGRVLIGELGCTYCHDGGFGGAMALLSRPGPLLGAVARRADPAWLRRWIADPQSIKPGCGMPRVLPEGAPEVEQIVHYLVSIAGGPFERGAVTSSERGLERGKRLFDRLGCVVCHGPSASIVDGGAPATEAPQPYGKLARKWSIVGLRDFLKDPGAVHPAGRMPNMLLSDEQADLLANFLRASWDAGQAADTGAFVVDAEKAKAGEKAFLSSGCAGCHQLGEEFDAVESTLKGTPLSELAAKGQKGCLDPNDKRSPRYTINAADRAAILAALREAPSWGQARAPVDETHRKIEALGCRLCHEYGGRGGPNDSARPFFAQDTEADLGDEGRLPPTLTGVGGKLVTQWTKRVLQEGGRARPYMSARMPQFGPVATSQLAEGLAQCEGVWPNTDAKEPAVSDAAVTAGRELAGAKGLNCISCHVFGDRPPAGTPGPDMTLFSARLRYDWWSRYVDAPQRFKPGTRMTSFFQSGKSQVTSILEGNPRRQAEALWQYFSLGENMPPPEGLPVAGGLTLSARGKPVVMRSFMRDAGVRAIAVGYPGDGPHFAFDGARARLVEAWRGSFLEMSGSWAGRGGNNVGGQGEIFWHAPDGPAVFVGSRPSTEQDAADFRGYRLDDGGVPTFLWRIVGADGGGGVLVEERFTPVATGEAGLFKRRFVLKGALTGKRLGVVVGAGTTEVVGVTGAKAEEESGDSAEPRALYFKAERDEVTVELRVVK